MSLVIDDAHPLNAASWIFASPYLDHCSSSLLLLLRYLIREQKLRRGDLTLILLLILLLLMKPLLVFGSDGYRGRV